MDIAAARSTRLRAPILLLIFLIFTLTLVRIWISPIGDEQPDGLGSQSVVETVPKSLVPQSLNKMPVAIVTPSSAQVLVKERLALSARESYDPDGTIIEYRWSLEPRGELLGKEVTLMFTEPGFREIVLTVEDNSGGVSSAVASVEVLPQSTEPILILSAGPNNMLDLRAGADRNIVLQIVAYNQPVSDVKVEIIDDGGLEVSVEDFPSEMQPGEPAEIRIKISARDIEKDTGGSIVVLRAVGEQAVSDNERLEVMIRSPPALASPNMAFIELLAIVMGFIFVYVVVSKWKGRR